MTSTSLPKSVLFSPGQSENNNNTSRTTYSLIRNRANFNEEVHVNALQCQEEAHKNRIKNIRKELEFIKATNWKYQPVEKFVGPS